MLGCEKIEKDIALVETEDKQTVERRNKKK